MHDFSNLFWNNTLRVSDGLSVHHQESKTLHTALGICTVLGFWRWTERPSETCRMLLQNKINLRYCASGWFHYINILRCTVLKSSNIGLCSLAVFSGKANNEGQASRAFILWYCIALLYQASFRPAFRKYLKRILVQDKKLQSIFTTFYAWRNIPVDPVVCPIGSLISKRPNVRLSWEFGCFNSLLLL